MKKQISWSVVFATMTFASMEAWARAGGGGGGGGSGRGSIIQIILLPFFLAYSAWITHIAYKKNQECDRLLGRLRVQDPAWDESSIRARIEQTFFHVQQAWMARNQNLARSFMSDRIFEKHKLQTDEMIAQHRQNKLKDMNLQEVQIVDVDDFQKNQRDFFWALIKGSMIDYMADDKTGKLISGNEFGSEHFQELWKFIRSGNNWMLDEIRQDVSLSALEGFHAYSEASGK